ncbi:hypothetical protein SHIRM173S_02197 [Streptomyces hirsutus]
MSRVPVWWSTIPTDRNSADLNAACASSITSPASAAVRVPAPSRAVSRPSSLTVP